LSEYFFSDFLASDDTLRIYRGKKLVFTSKKDRLLPLMEYIADSRAGRPPVTIYDKIMGNAAALLSVRANAREVYSPLGSQLAIETLAKHGIVYHLGEVVPYILRDDGQGMCPMEQLSIGKEPEECYQAMKAKFA
jgi:hypothetical protein